MILIPIGKGDFEGSGYRGAGFELQGYQERNKQQLLDTLGAAEKTFEQIAKTKKETWREMGEGFSKMESFARMGGVTSLLGGSISRVQDTIGGLADAMLAPLVTKITEKFGEIATAIQGFMDDLDEMTLATTNAGQKFSVLDAALEGASAAMFGLPGLFAALFGTMSQFSDQLGLAGLDYLPGYVGDPSTSGGLIENKIDMGL